MRDSVPTFSHICLCNGVHSSKTGGILFREYCFGGENSLSFGANSVSSGKNSVSSRLHINNRLKGTHWVRSPVNSVSPKKLTELGVWNRTPRNRIRPVSDFWQFQWLSSIPMDFQSFSVNYNHFQSLLVIFNHFQSFSITFCYFNWVKNAGVYWQPEGGGKRHLARP